MGVSLNGGTQQPMGFPIKKDHLEVFWGYHHFRKPPLKKKTTYIGIFRLPIGTGIPCSLCFSGKKSHLPLQILLCTFKPEGVNQEVKLGVHLNHKKCRGEVMSWMIYICVEEICNIKSM